MERLNGKKKKQEEAPAGSPAWMATFSDLMNLLLCFFVLLFAMSSTDTAKFEELAQSLASSFSIFSAGGSAVGEGELIASGVRQLNNLGVYFSNLGVASESEVEEDIEKEYEKQKAEEQKEATEEQYEKVKEELKENGVDSVVDVEMDSEFQYVMLSMKGGILFASGSADLMEEAKPVVGKLGVVLKKFSKYEIRIEGHTDNVPISSSSRYGSNMALSAARSGSVYDYLVNNAGLNAKNLSTSGYGENQPIVSNNTANGRAKNRRVVIKIMTSID